MEAYQNAIDVQHLTKRFDGFTLGDVSFSVPKGSIMGFIGQNGSGKTTSIRCMLNLLRYDEGSISLLGKDVRTHEREVKAQLSAVFDEIPFHDSLTPAQLSTVLSYLFEEWDEALFYQYLERFSLPKKRKVGDLSKGMKMKLQIAAALSHNARLMIMDEPTTGLDPVVRNEILDIFLEYMQDEEHSILLSSHITTDLDKIADYVTFIHNGKLLLTGNKDELTTQHAIMRCKAAEFQDISPEDYISARVTEYGAEMLVSSRTQAEKKYSGLVFDKTNLEEMMLFYVRREKKEWKP